MEETSFQKQDGFSRLIAVALEGPVPLLIMLIPLIGGIVALMTTPREE